MNKSITFNFTFRNYNKVKDSEKSLPLILRLLPFQKQAKTPFKIPPKHWDKVKQEIKPRFRDQHQTLIEELKILKDKLSAYPRKIQSGEIYPDNVLDEIFNIKWETDLNETICKYIEAHPSEFGPRAINKHLANVRGVEKHLNTYGSSIKEITINMLNDNRIIDEIVLALRKAPLKNSTTQGYMATLDLVTKKAKLNNLKPFKNRDLKPKLDNSNTRKQAKETDVILGMNKIKTYKDIEAYLWFLYMYCLQGLDYVDISNLDEKAIDGYKGETITHYYPFGEYIESEGGKVLIKKWHIRGDMKRSKTKAPINCMVNLFPTLFIRDWLLWIMRITSPQIAYNGKDRFRLFNFKVSDSSGKTIDENYDKLKKYYTPISKKMKKLFGVPAQLSRHTYTQVGKRLLGLTKDQMDMQLNHKLKSSADFYHVGEDMEEIRDDRQYYLIQQFGVNEYARILFEKVIYDYKAGKICLYKKQKAIPGTHPAPAKLASNDMLIGWALLKHMVSSDWTYELDKEFTSIKLELRQPKPDFINGEAVIAKRTEEDYGPRYKQLNEIRKKAFGDFPILISKNGGIKVTDKFLAEKLEQDKILDTVNKIIQKG